MAYNNVLTTPMLEILGLIPPREDLPEDQKFTTGTGQHLRVHSSDKCVGEHCVIHNPSTHVMSEFPTHWRGDRSLMERICPHGYGHPDPDGIASIAVLEGTDRARIELVHGCDGCCANCYYGLEDSDA